MSTHRLAPGRSIDARDDSGDVTGPARLLMGVSLVTSASFLVLLVLVVVAPRYGVSHWSRGPVLAVVLTALVVLVSAVRRLGPVVQWLERRAVVRRTLMSVALISMVLVQVRVGRAVRFFPGWDAGLMEKDAWGLSHGDLGAHAVARELAAFPN